MAILTTVVVVVAVAVAAVSAGPPKGKCIDGVIGYHADPEDCVKFYHCSHGEPIERRCNPGTVFNERLIACVHTGSYNDECTPKHHLRACENGEAELIPHPTMCQAYYNCSDKSPRYPPTFYEEYEQECKYPEQFDLTQRKCVPYKQAVCGEGRKVAKWECDYLYYQCPVAMCRPCFVDHPSCVGKTDGKWPNPYKHWSPYYVQCKDERSVYHGEVTCPKDGLTGAVQIFHPDKRRCLPPWEIPEDEGGWSPSCRNKPDGYYQVKEFRKVAYHCPGTEKFYCDPPLASENDDINRCARLYY